MSHAPAIPSDPSGRVAVASGASSGGVTTTR
jgi:hypothetical protein